MRMEIDAAKRLRFAEGGMEDGYAGNGLMESEMDPNGEWMEAPNYGGQHFQQQMQYPMPHQSYPQV